MADSIEDIEEEGADGKNTPNRLRISTQCGGCRFLHKFAAKGNDKPCIHLGFNESTMACDMYDPDYHVPRNRIDVLGPIYARLDELLQPVYDDVPAKLTEHEIGNIAYAIGNSERLKRISKRKRGEELRVGLKVFLFMELPDTKKEFANLWYEAYVGGLSRPGKGTNEDFITLYSSVVDLEGGKPNGNKWAVITVPIDTKSLITEEQMQDKLVRMLERGDLNYEHADFPQVAVVEDGDEVSVETVHLADAPDSIMQRAKKKFAEKLKLREFEARTKPAPAKPVFRRRRFGNFSSR